MVSEKIPNRWLILFASLAINICIGSLYAWSVYRIPLMEVLQASASEATLAVSISLGVIPIAMIVAGKFQDRVGPKPVIFVGGIIFGAAMILTGFVSSLTMLYITYGILGGAGVGTIYACTVANTVKFFPDKRGMASGLVVAGFGSGAVLIGPLSRWLIEIYTVLPTFQVLGVAYVVLISLCVTQVKTAPAGFAPAGWTPPAPAGGGTAAASFVDKNWREMLSDPLFFILYGVYTVACLSGLTLIAHASPIAQEVTSVTAAVAAAAVGYMALANTGGRIFWGWASDKIGRFNVLYVMFGITALMMIGMSQVTTIVPYVVVLMAVVLCFGGFMGCFPSITAEAFGAKNLGMNYGIIFTAYGVAGIAGPLLAARIRETTGNYTMAFIIFGGMSVLGIVLSFLAKQATQKRLKA
jgi:OFA family oxalate/formate antiporter-like MFS transporter